MPKPPGPAQNTYRGRIRADIRSAYNHMLYLWKWDGKFRNKLNITYPNQLAPAEEIDLLTNAIALMFSWLESQGPIPDASEAAAFRRSVRNLQDAALQKLKQGREPLLSSHRQEGT